MGNNQGNQKGTAQDQRERANEVQKGDSKDSNDTQRRQKAPLDKGGARGREGSEPDSLNKKGS